MLTKIKTPIFTLYVIIMSLYYIYLFPHRLSVVLELRLVSSLNSCSQLIQNLARLFVIPLTSRSSYFFSHSKWLFESDFVVCRLGNAQGLAKTFTKWQSFISTPNLDRKFASILTVTPIGIIISGAITFTAVLVKTSYSYILY